MKNRILLIAYSYPPLSDPQSIRWFYLSNLLAKRGYKIDVVTIHLPKNFAATDFFKMHYNITVFRVFPGYFENVAYTFKTRIGTDKDGNIKKRKRKRFQILKNSYWFMKKAIGSALIGDIKTEWMPFCIKFIKTINLNKYNVLITSQEPFVDSLIGLKIKKKKPDIFWIADMGDSVMSEYYPKWKRGVDTYFERKVVEKSDVVTLTNKKIVDIFLDRYKVEKNKFSIITQGFCKEEVKSFEYKNRYFTMLFAGTFYKKFREPDNLIEAIKGLNIDMRFIIAGRNESFMDMFEPIKDKVEFLGFVPYFESLDLQKKADVLVNIGNKQDYQIPGKIFEYLGSRKPILNIVYNEKDETTKVIEELNVGVVCRNSPEDIKKTILDLYNIWKNDELKRRFYFQNPGIDKYSWQAQAEKLDILIKSKER